MKDWKRTLLSPEDSIQKAIEVIDQAALGIALVVDERKALLGTVTDGDIRRGLIRHLAMESPVSMVMNASPKTASVNREKKQLLALMKTENVHQLPLLDSDGRVVGLETLYNLTETKQYDNAVFLMAGGFGTRLRPLTNSCPKPMLAVGEQPILETILENFISYGFHSFFISVHYLAEKVKAYFGDGSRWGVTIEYVEEREPLGTAGALSLLPRDVVNQSVIVMNGDILTKVNFEHLRRFHDEQEAAATVCVKEYDFQIPYGVISSDEHRITGIVEKPVQRFFVGAGIYALSPGVIAGMESGVRLDMPDLLQRLVEQDKLVNMFPIHEYWLDVGRLDDYERAQVDVTTLV